IAVPHSGEGGRTALDRLHHPLRRLERAPATEAGAKEAIFHFLALAQLVDDALYALVDRDGKTTGRFAPRQPGERRGQANPIAPQVEECAAAASQIHADVRLQQHAVVEQARLATIFMRLTGHAPPNIAEQSPRDTRTAVLETGRVRVGDRQHELA